MPIVGLALHAVERGLGTLTVETSIGPDGVTTSMIIFDDGGESRGGGY